MTEVIAFGMESTPAQIEATMKKRCPSISLVEHLYASRDVFIEKLNANGVIRAHDISDLDRLGRCLVANMHWGICDQAARSALLGDGHHQVRACAVLNTTGN